MKERHGSPHPGKIINPTDLDPDADSNEDPDDDPADDFGDDINDFDVEHPDEALEPAE